MDIPVKELRVERGRVIERDIIEHIPDEDVRDNVFCTRCGFPEYPKCQKECIHYKNFLKMENKNN